VPPPESGADKAPAAAAGGADCASASRPPRYCYRTAGSTLAQAYCPRPQHDRDLLPRPPRRRGQRNSGRWGLVPIRSILQPLRRSRAAFRLDPSARSRSWRRWSTGISVPSATVSARLRQGPGPLAGRGACFADRPQRPGASAASAVISRDTTGSEATSPASSGWERSTRDISQAVPAQREWPWPGQQ